MSPGDHLTGFSPDPQLQCHRVAVCHLLRHPVRLRWMSSAAMPPETHGPPTHRGAEQRHHAVAGVFHRPAVAARDRRLRSTTSVMTVRSRSGPGRRRCPSSAPRRRTGWSPVCIRRVATDAPKPGAAGVAEPGTVAQRSAASPVMSPPPASCSELPICDRVASPSSGRIKVSPAARRRNRGCRRSSESAVLRSHRVGPSRAG